MIRVVVLGALCLASCRGSTENLVLDLGDGVTLELVRIPAGVFHMGSPEDEPGRDPDEHLHRVEIGRPFSIGTYEVTQEQWRRVMDANPSAFLGELRLPVDSVTWEDAVAFCERLSRRVGRRCRLPTEAEWEYSCRAGTTTAFGGGDDLTVFEANFDWSHGGATGEEGPQQTVVVGIYEANEWRLHDMHGNVREWCADWYDRDEYTRSPLRDPTGPPSGTAHVLRGGCWEDYGRRCRSAYRHGYRAGDRDECIGLRICVEIE